MMQPWQVGRKLFFNLQLLAAARPGIIAGNARVCRSSSSSCLGADPDSVAQARTAVHRALSGAFSRETLPVPRGAERGFSLHEMQLAGSCCLYGRQKWGRSLTVICTGGHCGVELLDAEFQPPGSGRLVSLSVGESVNLPPGRGYYLRGGPGSAATRCHGSDGPRLPARILVISVPPLDGTEVQDCDGSFPPPPTQ